MTVPNQGKEKNLYEWNEAVQKIIDWIEDNLAENPSLLTLSKQIGYSPYYCSKCFHEISGMTIREYIAGRKLARATLEIRDTDQKLLDIAVKYGYSSHEALTRAFVNAYGCTPSAYRRKPVPIPMSIRQVVLFPEHFNCKGERIMRNTILTQPNMKMEHIPAHKYIGIWDITVDNYCDFWKKHDCDSVCGFIDSMSHVYHPIVTGHTAGWFYENGKKGYFYGFGVDANYRGEIPKGFTIKTIPASDYMVFFHPPFDYLKDCGEVMSRVENLAWNFDPKSKGYTWNHEVCPDYQRHYPEVIGYEVLRAVRKIES